MCLPQQQLSVLEEVIEYCTLPPMGNPVAEGRRALVCNMWNERIKGAKRNVEFDPETTPATARHQGPPQVMLAYLKYQWSLGEDHKRKEAFARLQDLAMNLSRTATLQPVKQNALVASSGEPLVACMYLRLGTWKWTLSPGLDDDSIHVMSHYTLRGFANIAAQFVVAAITGYFHSIACGAHAKGFDDSLQDILRLLTLWFNHGATSEVQMALQKGFTHGSLCIHFLWHVSQLAIWAELQLKRWLIKLGSIMAYSLIRNCVDRLRRVNFAAAKQCQRLHEMVLNPPINVGGLLPLVKNSKLSIIATAEAKPEFSALSSIKKELAGLIIIGPEGGKYLFAAFPSLPVYAQGSVHMLRGPKKAASYHYYRNSEVKDKKESLHLGKPSVSSLTQYF
ncbi:hypothetical protein MTR67_006139 [Solanum verrucosum]|uniref:Uncharacterized protein n=1 Tax=Solanum verrucosum TaxID=315347 RepID=A0AAF0Q3G3_SOLVR|nr:hypothetical protein MTR67_006139 [Solanum verrucosum]